MTVRINFLPRNYQPPRQLGTKDWVIAAAAAVAVVGTGVFYMSAFAGASKLEALVMADQTRLQEVKGQLAQAAEIRAREERLALAESELKSLAGRHWSGVLITLSELTPQHVTWASLGVKGDEITLMASSRGLVDIAQLLGGLIDHSLVEQVALRYVNENGVPITVKASSKPDAEAKPAQVIGTFRRLEFELVITLVRPEGGKPNGA